MLTVPIPPQLQQEIKALRQENARLRAQEAHHRRVEDALRTSEARHQALLNALPDTIIHLSQSGVILECYTENVTDREQLRHELVGKTVSEILPEETALAVSCAMQQAQRTGNMEIVEFPYPFNGSRREIEARILATEERELLLIARDFTEAKQLQAQFLHAQKIEAVGRLAGGVAHDFNNLLMAVMGYAELAAEKLPPESEVQTDLAQIQTVAQQAAALTRQLLIFSHRKVAEPQILDLNEITIQAGDMLRRLLRADIELRIQTAPALWKIKADPIQMGQILMNMVVNARDAMPQGGVLALQTANVTLPPTLFHAEKTAPAGDYVQLKISDNGIGMDKETLKHLFEPFFTTKEPGKGTGLGLATCYSIVQQSEGFVQVDSTPNIGTTFSLFLPRVEEEERLSALQELLATPLGGTETLLLVEDAPEVRTVILQSLRRLEYKVLVATSGEEAVRIAKKHASCLALVISDIVLPQMSGGELKETLINLLPQVNFLFISGHAENDCHFPFPPDSETPFLPKPFTPATLARKVRELLDG